jgi:hypothetical protein
LIGYQPNNDVKTKVIALEKLISVIYIPRKLHSNELKLFVCVTFINNPRNEKDNFPFILNILLHFKIGDISPIQTIDQIMNK